MTCHCLTFPCSETHCLSLVLSKMICYYSAATPVIYRISHQVAYALSADIKQQHDSAPVSSLMQCSDLYLNSIRSAV